MTSLKIYRLEPQNHPFAKENHLNQTSIILFPFTLPETDIAPENRQSQKETSIPTSHFQGYVSFREGNFPGCSF